MTWIEDGAPCPWGLAGSAGDLALFIAVGWLEKGQAFETAPSQTALTDRLRDLCRQEKQLPTIEGALFRYFGMHVCEFCEFTMTDLFYPKDVAGNGELYVPDMTNGHVWLAPHMITHYVEDHEYRPPQGFVDAVMSAPDYGTSEFFEKMNAITGADWRTYYVNAPSNGA